MVGYEIITLQKIYSKLDGGTTLIVHSIIKNDLRPAVKELETVLKTLKDQRDKQICQSLNQLIQACWNGCPNLRPTAVKGFL